MARYPVEELRVPELPYLPRVDIGSSVMLMGAAWVSEPGYRPRGPGSRNYYWKASLFMGMLEDLFRCHSFEWVKFFCVDSSECSYTRFFQFTRTVLFLMCLTVENVSSKTTWYWGEIYLVLLLNTRATGPVWNGECTRDILGKRRGNPRCDSPLRNFWTPRLKTYAPSYFRTSPSSGCCIFGTLTWTIKTKTCYSQPLTKVWWHGGEGYGYIGSI